MVDIHKVLAECAVPFSNSCADEKLYDQLLADSKASVAIESSERSKTNVSEMESARPGYSETRPVIVAATVTAMVSTCARKNGFEECQPK